VSAGPTRTITVEVPASTANLGAGFDVLALALDLVNEITVGPSLELPAGEVFTDVLGEGATELAGGRPNRFTEAFLGSVGESDHGWHVEMRNAIPLARGLGSSAAATVAGLVCGRALRTDRTISDDDLLAIATRLEGHPENAAASLLGGFVVAAASADGPSVVRLDVPAPLQVVLFIPDQQLATSEMRAVLPADVPREDAIHNVGRAALAVAAFASGRLDRLGLATEDRLHEPYREKVFPALPILVGAAREAGALGACLSGAGSTIVAFADSVKLAGTVSEALAAAALRSGLEGRPLVVAPRALGANVRAAGPATG
jgi:homoserine kinase